MGGDGGDRRRWSSRRGRSCAQGASLPGAPRRAPPPGPATAAGCAGERDVGAAARRAGCPSVVRQTNVAATSASASPPSCRRCARTAAATWRGRCWRSVGSPHRATSCSTGGDPDERGDAGRHPRHQGRAHPSPGAVRGRPRHRHLRISCNSRCRPVSRVASPSCSSRGSGPIAERTSRGRSGRGSCGRRRAPHPPGQPGAVPTVDDGAVYVERRFRFLGRDFASGERVGRYSLAYLMQHHE